MTARSLRAVAMAFCLALVSACAGIAPSELESIGSRVEPTQVEFSSLLAYAERSEAAYATPDAIRARYPSVVRIATPGRTDVQYFLERNDKDRTQHITVRGTVDRRNWVEDINAAITTDNPSGLPVHAGFAKVSRAIYDDARPYLRSGYRTHVTGHSLGGAVAAVLAIQLHQSGQRVERVVTFGQPRFTTASGTGRVGFLPITRVVDENDIVPMLPPAGIGAGRSDPFDHAGPEVILLEGQRFSFIAAHDAGRLAIGEFGRSLSVASVRDHDIKNYIGRIRSKLNGAVQVPYKNREQFVAR